MLKNYLIIGWRNILKKKEFAAINISGLAISMAVVILIGLWGEDEMRYNQSFQHYDRLGQLYHHVTFGDEIMTINDVPAPIGETLKNNYAEFDAVAITSWPEEHVITYNETPRLETGLFVAPQFTEMFSVEMAEGTDVLTDVHAVLVSKTLAASLFNHTAMGETITLDNQDELVVHGVYEDFPSNSAFAEVKILLPLAHIINHHDANGDIADDWDNYSFQCFVQLHPDVSFDQVTAKIKDVLYENASEDGKAVNPKGFIFPMKQWHLYADFRDGMNTGGAIRFVWMFGTIGVFVLLLACINFMNLSTAQSEKRSKEVGIRKTMGSLHRQLIVQFLHESFLMVGIGFIISLALAYLTLPWFNALTGKSISMPWTDLHFVGASLVFIMVVSLLAGSYPAFYLSLFSPVKVLKGHFKTGRYQAWPRKVMATFQFTLSIVLAICTLVVFFQIQHAKDRPVGFDREGIIHLALRTYGLIKADYNTLRHELLTSGAVENMAMSDHPITGSMGADASLTWEGKDPALRPLMAMNSCSHDFPKTNGFQFVAGRDFSRQMGTDSQAVIVNEMAAKLIADDNVLGKKLRFGNGKEHTIIGVIKDQVRWTPFSKQSPHLYYVNYTTRGFLTIRLNPHMETHEAVQRVEAVIKKFDAGAPFDYQFQDDDYARQFQDTERIGKLATVFSMLAVFISCIGIFGLATFAASQRTKEIGIRKVLGASVFRIWKMLSADFVRLMVVSILISMPLAYYLATEWLQQYDYRVDLPWIAFVVTGVVAMFITLLTVSYQALKAALINPVKSLGVE